MDPERVCRIRNRKGDPKDLPNTTGWILREELEATAGGDSVHQLLVKLKQEFRRAHPRYTRTLYRATNAALSPEILGLDPNMARDMETRRLLPWPPESPPFQWRELFPEFVTGTADRTTYQWQSPSPLGRTVSTATVNDSEGILDSNAPELMDTSTTTPQGKKRLRKTTDGPYAYTSDSDSDDDLKPDVDDLTSHKRRRVEDPTYRPPQAERHADEESPAEISTTMVSSGKKKKSPVAATLKPKGKGAAAAAKETPSKTVKPKATPKKATPKKKEVVQKVQSSTRVTRSMSRAAS